MDTKIKINNDKKGFDISKENNNNNNSSHDSGDDSDDDSDYDQEFTCNDCDTTQGINACELCNNENICEECYGQGGDYGPNEIWVCNDCLPTCLKCNSKLYCAFDECCGEGRSDIPLEIKQS